MFVELIEDCQYPGSVIEVSCAVDGYKPLSYSREHLADRIIITIELAKDVQHAGANNEASQNTSRQYVSRSPSDPRAWC